MIHVAAENRKLKGKQILMPVIMGILAALIASLILLAIFSVLLSTLDIPTVSVQVFACISIGAGALTGGFFSARILRNKGLLSGAATGLLFYAVLLIAGAAMGQADIQALTLLKVLLAVVFGAIGGIMGVNSKRRLRRLKGKKH